MWVPVGHTWTADRESHCFSQRERERELARTLISVLAVMFWFYSGSLPLCCSVFTCCQRHVQSRVRTRAGAPQTPPPASICTAATMHMLVANAGSSAPTTLRLPELSVPRASRSGITALARLAILAKLFLTCHQGAISPALLSASPDHQSLQPPICDESSLSRPDPGHASMSNQGLPAD
ncbi:hypothetical protein K439DRAFT_1094868 [Ramaria rubella]|nr:hypothetical protein K439DRAFT_1094868 [Ramaria rubella]